MRYLLLFIGLLLGNFSFATRAIVLFESDSYELSDQEKKKLNHIADMIIEKYDLNEIAIYGYTDHDGGKLYNNKLSENRASAVERYLKLQGVDNVIYIIGKGESELQEFNESDKANHRKVVVDLDYKSRNIIQSKLKEKTQVFHINPTQDNVITCKGGTKVFIPKNAFETLYGYSAEIRVDECLKKSEFLAHGLCTQTNMGELIESRGMINIEAVQYNRKLELRDDVEIQILFKDRKLNDNTQTFYGVENTNKITWEPRKDTFDFGDEKVWERYRGDKLINKGTIQYVEKDGDIYKVYKSQNTLGETQVDELVVSGRKKFDKLAIKSSRMNWINCDRFINKGIPLANLEVYLDSSCYGIQVSLVLDEYASIMSPAQQMDGRITFKNVPVNASYTVVAFFQNDLMKNPLLGEKKGKLYTSKKENVVLKEVSLDHLKSTLAKLD